MSVDCLTHYYPSQRECDLFAWVNAAAAELKPGGLLAVHDLIVPGSHRRGRKADKQRQAGGYVNAFLKMSGWQPALSQDQWQATLEQSGFSVVYERVTAVAHIFHNWATPLSSVDHLRLRVLLTQAPPPVLDYLTTHFAGDRIAFQLQELWIVGKK